MRLFEVLFEGVPHVLAELDDVIFLYPTAPVTGDRPIDLTPRASLQAQLPELQLERRALFISGVPPEPSLNLADEPGLRAALTLYGRPLIRDLIVPAATEAPRD